MFLIFFLGNLAFLRNQPQFQQLRQVVAQNPQALEPLLQQIGAANPALMQLIVENQQEFMQMLAGDDFEGGAGPGQQVIEVTPEEKEAIERVCQAFFFFLFLILFLMRAVLSWNVLALNEAKCSRLILHATRMRHSQPTTSLTT